MPVLGAPLCYTYKDRHPLTHRSQTATCQVHSWETCVPSQAAPNLRAEGTAGSSDCFHLLLTDRRRGEKEKTRDPFPEGQEWEGGAGISSHSFCLASLQLASYMENEDAFEWISLCGKIQFQGWRNSERVETFGPLARSPICPASEKAVRRSAQAPSLPVEIQGWPERIRGLPPSSTETPRAELAGWVRLSTLVSVDQGDLVCAS